MKSKEQTKTFMMISNWKEPFGLHGLYKNMSVLQELRIRPRYCSDFTHAENKAKAVLDSFSQIKTMIAGVS